MNWCARFVDSNSRRVSTVSLIPTLWNFSFTVMSVLTVVYTDLSAGVDVYSDWIDACDSVAKEAAYTTGDGEDSGQYYERAGLGDSEAHFEMAGVTRTSTGGRDDDDDVEGYGGDEFR